jgi:hypothetical protein
MPPQVTGDCPGRPAHRALQPRHQAPRQPAGQPRRVARRHLWTGVDHTSTSSNRRTVASIPPSEISAACGLESRIHPPRLDHGPSTPLANPRLEARPDIQAAMTMVGRLVAHKKDMAAVVTTYSCSTPTRRGALPSQRRPVSRAAPRRPPTRGSSLRDADRRGAFLVYAQQLSDVSLHCTELREPLCGPLPDRRSSASGACWPPRRGHRHQEEWPAGFDAAGAGIQFGCRLQPAANPSMPCGHKGPAGNGPFPATTAARHQL